MSWDALESFVLLGLVLPWALLLAYQCVSILRSGVQEWKRLDDWTEVAGWAALLILQLGIAGGSGLLLYSVLGLHGVGSF